jgi:hypothetical protein
METIKKECEFCLGENRREEAPLAEVLEQLSFRYVYEEHTLTGKACLYCIEFVLNHDDFVTDIKIGEEKK